MSEPQFTLYSKVVGPNGELESAAVFWLESMLHVTCIDHHGRMESCHGPVRAGPDLQDHLPRL